MASLDTLFLCSAGQQAWLCSELVLKLFTKTKAFVLTKLFLFLIKKEYSVVTSYKKRNHDIVSLIVVACLAEDCCASNIKLRVPKKAVFIRPIYIPIHL